LVKDRLNKKANHKNEKKRICAHTFRFVIYGGSLWMPGGGGSIL
jgi:hypothetical protein